MKVGDMIKFGPKDNVVGIGLILDVKDDNNIKVHMNWICSDMKWRDTVHAWSSKYIKGASEVVSK